jgi:hypothetical protein
MNALVDGAPSRYTRTDMQNTPNMSYLANYNKDFLPFGPKGVKTTGASGGVSKFDKRRGVSMDVS